VSVTRDPIYIDARNASFAEYERERDLSLKRKDRGEYKEGEFERERDAQRANYAAAMSRAYEEFTARERAAAVAASQVRMANS